jgi:hypothetical protein
MMKSIEKEWGRSDWPEPLLRALPPRARGFNDDAEPSLFGALVIKGQFRKSASNALGYEHLIAQHPEILQERIERPLFVLGLPRTGTTLLQRLLSLHSGARHLPFWEAYMPFPEEADGRPLSRETRHEAARRRIATLKWVAPELDKIHPIDVDDPEECYHLFRSHFLVPPGFDFAYVPSYWQWFDERAHADTYRMHKRQLQSLQWLDRRQHWVLKCPNHLSGIKQLLDVYPDARIVYTHRDPEKIIASLCSLTAVTWAMTSDEIDLSKVADFALSMAQRSQEAAQEALRTVSRDQIVHVEFDELVADPTGVASGIYKRFGYPADGALIAKMSEWLRDNPSDKHGKHHYQLSDFGLTAAEVRARLAASEPPASLRAGA